MAKLKLVRVNLTVFNKKNRSKYPARFYVNPNSEINRNILRRILRGLTNRYGSIHVERVIMDDVINPETKTPVMVPIWSPILSREVEVPLKKINTFKTGWDYERQQFVKDRDIVLTIESLVFKGIDRHNQDYYISLPVFRNWDSEKGEVGVVTNREILSRVRYEIEKNDDMGIDVEFDRGKSGKLYIKDINVGDDYFEYMKSIKNEG